MKTILRPSGEWADTEIKTQYDFIVVRTFSKIIKSNDHESNISVHRIFMLALTEKKLFYTIIKFSIKSYWNWLTICSRVHIITQTDTHTDTFASSPRTRDCWGAVMHRLGDIRSTFSKLCPFYHNFWLHASLCATILPVQARFLPTYLT